jgi:hypothetical protein
MFPAPGVVYHHFVNEGGDQPTTDMLRLFVAVIAVRGMGSDQHAM